MYYHLWSQIYILLQTFSQLYKKSLLKNMHGHVHYNQHWSKSVIWTQVKWFVPCLIWTHFTTQAIFLQGTEKIWYNDSFESHRQTNHRHMKVFDDRIIVGKLLIVWQMSYLYNWRIITSLLFYKCTSSKKC